jgi:hypothetical protein
MVKITFLYFEDCPSHGPALARLREVMAEEGMEIGRTGGRLTRSRGRHGMAPFFCCQRGTATAEGGTQSRRRME